MDSYYNDAGGTASMLSAGFQFSVLQTAVPQHMVFNMPGQRGDTEYLVPCMYIRQTQYPHSIHRCPYAERTVNSWH